MYVLFQVVVAFVVAVGLGTWWPWATLLLGLGLAMFAWGDWAFVRAHRSKSPAEREAWMDRAYDAAHYRGASRARAFDYSRGAYSRAIWAGLIRTPVAALLILIGSISWYREVWPSPAAVKVNVGQPPATAKPTERSRPPTRAKAAKRRPRPTEPAPASADGGRTAEPTARIEGPVTGEPDKGTQLDALGVKKSE